MNTQGISMKFLLNTQGIFIKHLSKAMQKYSRNIQEIFKNSSVQYTLKEYSRDIKENIQGIVKDFLLYFPVNKI